MPVQYRCCCTSTVALHVDCCYCSSLVRYGICPWKDRDRVGTSMTRADHDVESVNPHDSIWPSNSSLCILTHVSTSVLYILYHRTDTATLLLQSQWQKPLEGFVRTLQKRVFFYPSFVSQVAQQQRNGGATQKASTKHELTVVR